MSIDDVIYGCVTQSGEQGINVARRTVAKYREAMAVPSSSERKCLI